VQLVYGASCMPAATDYCPVLYIAAHVVASNYCPTSAVLPLGDNQRFHNCAVLEENRTVREENRSGVTGTMSS